MPIFQCPASYIIYPFLLLIVGYSLILLESPMGHASQSVQSVHFILFVYLTKIIWRARIYLGRPSPQQ